MPDDIQVGSASFKVTAQIDGLLANLQAGDEHIDHFVEHMEVAQGAIEAAFGLEAVSSIKEFVSEGVKEFENFDRSISVTVTNIERMGGAFEGLKEQVEEYAKTEALHTQFSKTETLDNLNELYTRTHNLSEATYVNNLAMDLAAAKNKSLSETAHELAFALTGDQRGVMMLSRELGISRDSGLSALELFQKVEEQFGGVARAQNDAKTRSEELRHNWGQLTEDIITRFAPGLSLMKEGMDAVARQGRAMLGDVDHDQQVLKLTRQIRELSADVVQLGKAYETTVGPRKDLIAEEIKLTTAKMNGLVAELDKLGEVEAAEKKREEAGRRAALADIQNKQNIKDMNAEEAEYQAEDDRNAKKQAEINDLRAKAMHKSRIDEFKEQEDHWHQVIKLEQEFGNTAATTISKDMTTFFDEVKKGTADIGQAFKDVGRDMAKGVLLGLAKVEEQFAAQDFVEAAAYALGYDYYDAAISAGKGGLWAAAAGATTSVANGLAKGGYTVGGNANTDTIPAMLKKNEVVVPLDDPEATAAMSEAMGGGGVTIQHLTINAADGKRETAQSHVYHLMDTVSRLNAKTGNRARRYAGAF